jgi:hypothetical protein
LEIGGAPISALQNFGNPRRTGGFCHLEIREPGFQVLKTLEIEEHHVPVFVQSLGNPRTSGSSFFLAKFWKAKEDGFFKIFRSKQPPVPGFMK